ncbi:MAG TPA: hypothetical protein VGC69_05685 [Bordetella sp.]
MNKGFAGISRVGTLTQGANQNFKPLASGLELNGVRAVLAMVSAGLGLSVIQLSEPNISQLFPVGVVALPDPPMIQFSLLFRASDEHSRALIAIRVAGRGWEENYAALRLSSATASCFPRTKTIQAFDALNITLYQN